MKDANQIEAGGAGQDVPDYQLSTPRLSTAAEQLPGCLPAGYDLDSLLTVRQAAIWRQVPVKKMAAELAAQPGRAFRWSRQDVRVHPRSYLAAVIKKTLT